MEWIDSLNRTLHYIEAHLDGELSLPQLAAEAHFSQFYLQRVFSVMTDLTLSEYIRQRRLSLAGQELQATDARVIDVALKYGYETPESFQKAFRRFHGITPAAVKKSGLRLRYLNPLQIQMTLIGGSIMDYSVESIGKLTVIGMERQFHYDSAFGAIPKFWGEYYSKNLNAIMPGYLGVCLDQENSPEFTYLIASFCEDDAQAPVGFVKREIAPHTWAKFRAVGKMPEGIQKVNRQIFTEWLPNNLEYELADGLNIEVYSMGDMDSDDYESEIWIPVVKKSV